MCGTTAIGPIGITMIVEPSGAAALTASAAIRPAAPGRFSTMHRLADRVLELVGDDARDEIGGAARREPDDDPHGLVHPVLRRYGRGDRKEQRAGAGEAAMNAPRNEFAIGSSSVIGRRPQKARAQRSIRELAARRDGKRGGCGYN